MSERTNAELAVLSLLAEQPRHGYEIEAVIEARGMRQWTEIGFSSIYYLLKKLDKAGLIEGRMVETGQGPARKVYRLTSEGEAALRAGVIDALSVPRQCYPPIQLGLANLPGLSTAEAVDALGAYRARLAQHLAQARGNRARQQPLPYFVEAMFDYSVIMIRAELEWVEGFVARLIASADRGSNKEEARRE